MDQVVCATCSKLVNTEDAIRTKRLHTKYWALVQCLLCELYFCEDHVAEHMQKKHGVVLKGEKDVV